MNYPQSKCVIVYPADDFINHTILDRMYNEFVKGIEILKRSLHHLKRLHDRTK